MVTLYVIGAGCSKNYSQSIHGIPGLTSPTNDDFFKMAKKVVASRNLGLLTYLDGPLGHLIDDLCGLYGYPKDYGIKVFDHNRLKLEDVITHFSLASEIFDKKFFPPPSTPAALNRVSTLVELIAITLAVALEGPTCLKHKKLADLMSARDVIISYNYDILLDNALFETGKLTDSGYCISFFRKYDGEWIKPNDAESAISLIKLHGSMNWLRCIVCGSNLLLYGLKFVSNFLVQGFRPSCPKCGASSFQLRRLIVPPSLWI